MMFKTKATKEMERNIMLLKEENSLLIDVVCRVAGGEKNDNSLMDEAKNVLKQICGRYYA